MWKEPNFFNAMQKGGENKQAPHNIAHWKGWLMGTRESIVILIVFSLLCA